MSYIATCHTDVFIHVDVHTCTCVLNASCTYMCTSCMHVEVHYVHVHVKHLCHAAIQKYM